MSGRRVQDAPKRMRMEVTETEEIILSTLPKQKDQAPRQPHSLKVAVANNSQNAKKH